MHWILSHLFYIIMVLLVVCAGMLWWATDEIPRWRRAVALGLYGVILVFLFQTMWKDGGVLPPPPPQPPAAWPMLLECKTIYWYNLPDVKSGDRDTSCVLTLVDPQEIDQ